MGRSENEIDLVQLVRTIWRAKGTILVFTFVAAVAAFLYVTKVSEPVYVASATVAVENRQSQTTDIAAIVGGMSADQTSLNTEIYLIESRQLLRRLVISEDLLSDPEFNAQLREKKRFSLGSLLELIFGAPPKRVFSKEELIRRAVDTLRGKLSVSNPRITFVFDISVAANSPEKATRLANAVAETYINDQLLFKEEEVRAAMRFLGVRTSDLQVELNEAELEVKDFAASIDLISPEALVAKNRQVKELRERLTALEAVAERHASVVAAYSTFDLTAEKVENLNNRLLSRLFAEATADAEAMTRFENAFALEEAKSLQELAQSERQMTSLTAAVTDLEQEVENESRDLLTLQQLQREAEAIGEIYGYFLARLKEAEVQQGTQRADARLFSPAVVPLRASSPRVMMSTVVFGMLGAIVAIGFALLRESTKGGVRTAEDLQKATGLSVLGNIPMAALKRRASLVPFLRKSNSAPFLEAIRNLRTSLLLSVADKEPRVVLLTSSVPGEGKTTTSIALAHSLIGMGKTVLLVEGDVRRNTLSQYFEDSDVTNARTTADLEFTLEAQRVRIEGIGFDLIFGRKRETNAADFFSSEIFQHFITAAREAYDHVIIDAPPILPVTDARIIGRYVDAILYAVSWDDTEVDLVKAGLSEFSNADLTPTGLIMTKIDGRKAKNYGGMARYSGEYADYS